MLVNIITTHPHLGQQEKSTSKIATICLQNNWRSGTCIDVSSAIIILADIKVYIPVAV